MNTAGLSRGIDADRTVPGQVNAAEGAGSDEELACLAVNGEEAALFELVRRYKFLVMKKAEAHASALFRMKCYSSVVSSSAGSSAATVSSKSASSAFSICRAFLTSSTTPAAVSRAF